MTEQEWIKKLESEGYTHIDVIPNNPYVEVPPHTHIDDTVYVVLDGELVLTDEKGNSMTVREGERFDVLPGTTHSGMTGPFGCVFIVGEKEQG